MNAKKKSPVAAMIPGAVCLTVMMLVSCATVPADVMDPVDLVDTVDVERYLGRWYEIARYQSGFEKSIMGATAEYSLRDDGRIQVVNSGFKKSLDGAYTAVKAVAWVPDPSVPAALKVKFFNLFTSDYMIIGLDQENYEWAIVGNNSREFLWFLSRSHTIDNDLYVMMENIALSQGFNTDTLFRVPQKPRG